MAAPTQDVWLEPDAPLASKGDELVLHLRAGESLTTQEERPLQKEKISRFDLFGNEAIRRDLLASGTDGQTPVARTRLESGGALVVMDRKSQSVTMEAAKFNEYLAAAGLDTVVAQRVRLGQTDTPGREVYQRFLKVLIQERDPNAATANTLYKRRVGKRLEILLENDPARLKPDGHLTVKVLFEGKPLAGAKVFANRRAKSEGQPAVTLSAVTSSKGLAEFALDQSGLWLVHLASMRPVAPGSKPDASAPQWESFWAAYTFAARLVSSGGAPASKPPSL